MPREDVPYPGGALCRLKCQINELWQAVRNKLHSINGVPGDGNGDVKILAGTNVQIVNDQVHNEITISATGGSAEDVVKSVNGELPDQDGDVVIDTGVMTVNGVSPDADGKVTITAGSNITITPDAGNNSIEIEANVAPPGFTLVSDKLWARYAVNNIAQTDLYIVIYGGSPILYGETFVPKGADVRHIALDLQATNAPYADYKYSTISNTPVSDILNDSTSYVNFGYKSLLYRDSSSSTIDSYFSIDYITGSSSMNKGLTVDSLGVRLFVKEVL